MLNLKVYKEGDFRSVRKLQEPIQIGRQDEGEPLPPSLFTNADGIRRFVFEKKSELRLPRKIATLSPQSNDSVKVTNDRERHELVLDQGTRIPPKQTRVIPAPFVIRVGVWTICIAASAETSTSDDQSIMSLPQAPRSPGSVGRLATPQRTIAETFVDSNEMQVDFELVFRCVGAALDVVEQAATSASFYQNAARAVTRIAGMERAAVMLWENDQWTSKAEHSPGLDSRQARPISRRVLDRVREEKRTVLYYPHLEPERQHDSLGEIYFVIASPILSISNEVSGVVYADHAKSRVNPANVEKLEAMFVELVASGVAAGIARLDKEVEIIRLRGQLEAFFTPRLVKKLENDRDLLKPREQNVTVMSCDIRGFSRIAERVGPETTLEWINEALTELSNIVLEGFEGVVVDYVGDELMAMWGAPDEQPDHAQRACDSAIQMIAATEKMAERWQSRLKERFQIGIGINSGPASVGNTGSERKFKYGPLGTTVNVASRVQSLTKHLASRLLITDDTVRQLNQTDSVRRICKTHLFNISQPVTLYELCVNRDSRWEALKAQYETALADFEQRSFREAIKKLGEILVEYPDDSPSRQLLVRTVAAWGQEDRESVDIYWRF